MKEVIKFEMGSSVFFGGMDGYKQKDRDILVLMDEWQLKSTNILNLKDKNGDDVFFHKIMPKNKFIESTLSGGVPMRVGKFLIPDFAKYIGLTIDDLKRLKPLIDAIDERHSYERIIYESYIENNDFNLTDEQRKKAYKEYLSKKEKAD